MNILQLESRYIVGISVRTTNENNQAMQDIPMLWQRFMEENMMEKIPNKIEHTIYCLYTDYELDHTKPYTTIIGCRVDNLDTIPDGMTGRNVECSQYAQFTAKGDITQGAVYHTWVEIWNSSLDRNYKTDFEMYGEKAINWHDAEVEIFIGI